MQMRKTCIFNFLYLMTSRQLMTAASAPTSMLLWIRPSSRTGPPSPASASTSSCGSSEASTSTLTSSSMSIVPENAAGRRRLLHLQRRDLLFFSCGASGVTVTTRIVITWRVLSTFFPVRLDVSSKWSWPEPPNAFGVDECLPVRDVLQ
jgi:hypothetical protein